MEVAQRESAMREAWARGDDATGDALFEERWNNGDYGRSLLEEEAPGLRWLGNEEEFASKEREKNRFGKEKNNE